MHETLKKLYRDHGSFFKLMDLLERELNAMESEGKESARLLLELVNYTRNYSDAIHHPVEDHLYQLILTRTEEGRSDMEQLLGHHQVIMQMTRELRQALEAGAPTAELVKAGRGFMEHQRSHMKFEEEKAFPLLTANLQAADFEYASGALPADEDPLLDPLLRDEYPLLVAALERG